MTEEKRSPLEETNVDKTTLAVSVIYSAVAELQRLGISEILNDLREELINLVARDPNFAVAHKNIFNDVNTSLKYLKIGNTMVNEFTAVLAEQVRGRSNAEAKTEEKDNADEWENVDTKTGDSREAT